MGKYNIARGEKWSKIRDAHEFHERKNEVEWMDSQASIVEDIKEYKDSIKEEPKLTKSKGKK